MIDKAIQQYADTWSNVQDPILEEIERSTHLHTLAPQMLSGRIQGGFLTFLTSLSNATHVLEIGTFTAYGTICLAKGLSSRPDAKVISMEANPEYRFLIDKHLGMSGLADRVEVMYGDALELIGSRKEVWDVVFIDANKQEYPAYYSLVLDQVRPGGLILSDNVLWSGKVVFEKEDVDAKVLHEYNEMLHRDDRVEVLLLPLRDGLSIARKK